MKAPPYYLMCLQHLFSVSVYPYHIIVCMWNTYFNPMILSKLYLDKNFTDIIALVLILLTLMAVFLTMYTLSLLNVLPHISLQTHSLEDGNILCYLVFHPYVYLP